MEGVLDKVVKDGQWEMEVVQYDVEDPIGQQFKLELVLQNVRPQKLPSFIVFHNGQAVGQKEGMMTAVEMEDFLRSCAVPQPAKGLVNLSTKADSYMLSSV